MKRGKQNALTRSSAAALNTQKGAWLSSKDRAKRHRPCCWRPKTAVLVGKATNEQHDARIAATHRPDARKRARAALGAATATHAMAAGAAGLWRARWRGSRGATLSFPSTTWTEQRKPKNQKQNEAGAPTHSALGGGRVTVDVDEEDRRSSLEEVELKATLYTTAATVDYCAPTTVRA